MSGEGGFGGGPWGGGAWGGSSGADGDLVVAPELVVIAESLGVSVPFEVVAAASLSATLVRVDFTSFINPAVSTPGLYDIPGLTVVDQDPLFGSPKSVILRTSPQSNTSYTVTVDPSLTSLGSDALDPGNNTATFTGLAPTASFMAVGQSRRKILLTFSEAMTLNSAFIATTNYEVVSLKGEGLLVTGVHQTGPDNTRAYLTVASDLEPNGYYTVKILPSVTTLSGKFLLPDQVLFQWKEARSTIRIPITSFSGEVASGLLGVPAGQAFFSPALDVSVANSTLQVDSVSVCTRAYDVYSIPGIPDPLPLFTWPGPLTGGKSQIGAAGGVLIASAHRLGQAIMAIQNRVSDTMPDADDGPATGTLEEPIDITRASFLNDDRWRTFPGSGATLGAFMLADNLTFIGPGPTVVIALQA